MGKLQLVEAERVDFFVGSRSRFDRVVGRLESSEAGRMTHDELERMLAAEGKDLLRGLLQDHLRLRAHEEEDLGRLEGKDGVERSEVRSRARTLQTTFGPVEVERNAYGARGVSSLMPLDAELNLPVESYSFELRRRVARMSSTMSFSEVVEELSSMGIRMPKRQVEQVAVRSAVDFDAFYALRRQDEAGPPPSSRAEPMFLALTTDAKGVVMRKEALREMTRRAAARERESGKTPPHQRRRKKNKKRMAQVASVYDVAPFVRRPEDIALDLAPVPEDQRAQRPPRPVNKRVWASIEKNEERVIDEMFQEALLRDPDHQRPWVVLVDGDESQLDAVLRCEKQYGVAVTIVLDIIHVLQRLWDAGKCLEHRRDDVEEWVTERLLRVLDGKASQVAAGMRRSATKRRLPSKNREPLDKCADYLLKYRDFMRYDVYLEAGMPIATGVIEGTCRSLINDRMDITGARWGLRGAESVLRLRSLRKSKDFDEYWAFHVKQEQKRNHLDRYAEGLESGGDEPSAKLRVIEGGRE